MIHLTHTGYNAGSPLCRCDKTAARERGEEFLHAMYGGAEYAQKRGDCCPVCAALWHDECYRTVPGAARSFTGGYSVMVDGEPQDCPCQACETRVQESIDAAVDAEVPAFVGRPA